MVNLGKTFSIAVVFILTLALLAVPALTPPVALADDPLPNPLTVNFSATVSEGNNFSFNVVPNATIGTVITQFARHWMIINQTCHNNTNATFYNMSTASGTVSGDLAGNIALKWSMLDFNLTYVNTADPPNTTLYIDPPDGVGILYTNFTVTGTVLGDLTFVGAADYDYNSTLVKGEGRVMSVEDWETGITTAPDRVLIGDMSYEINSTTISGTFSLRSYAKHPVGLEGTVNTTREWIYLKGQLIVDESDWITNETVEFVQFAGDPVLAGTEVEHRIVLEEMAPGRELDQTITAGDMGANGSISLMRTGVLDTVWVPIADADVPKYSVTGTRTIENNTGSDDPTKWGMAYTIVLVDMVNFCITEPCPGGGKKGIDQHSFTMMPGYSEGYLGTGYYAGVESYVIPDTHINLDFTLFGDDYRWRLDAKPQITSVSPNESWVGNTTEVTIDGKWFWTNTSYHPLNISFGPGVAVDWQNCTVLSDTQVKVNITIPSGADVYPRDVSVTKRGVTGTLAGGFNVKGPTGTLQGHVSLSRYGGVSWNKTPLNVTFCNPVGNSTLYTRNVTTDANGNFTIPGVGRGTYDIAVKNWTTLSKMKYGQEFTKDNITPINFGLLTEGDTDNDDFIKGGDYNDILTRYFLDVGDPLLDPNKMYDFDRSGKVSGFDYNQVLTRYFWKGDLYKY